MEIRKMIFLFSLLLLLLSHDLVKDELKTVVRSYYEHFNVITDSMAEASRQHALNKHNSRNTTVVISIEKGRVTLVDSSSFKSNHLWDNQRLQWTLEQLKLVRMPDKRMDIVYNPHDCPIRGLFNNATRSDLAPMFGNIRCHRVPHILPLPQWYYRRDGSFFTFGGIFRNQDWRSTWSQRQGRAVFRGAIRQSCLLPTPQGPKFANHSTERPCGRMKLRDVQLQYPYLLDIAFEDDQHMPLEEQALRFKYVIYAEGNCGWADRLKLLLRSGMVILLQDTPCHEWYQELMHPYIHYVPVSNDWSDLVRQIEWLRAHDQKARRIISRAYALGETLLNYRTWQLYIELLLAEYAKNVE
jgi:hypothetical protein